MPSSEAPRATIGNASVPPGSPRESASSPGSGPGAPAGIGRHVVNVPDTSLSLVEAWLPVTVVSSMTTVPPGRRSSPPPMPTPGTPAVPAGAGAGEPRDPPRGPARPGLRPSSESTAASLPPVGLVARDGVGGLRLIGALPRAQPGLDGEGAGDGVEDAAAEARAAVPPSAAIAARAPGTGTAETAVAAAAALTEAATRADATGAAVGLVIREVHGDAGEGGGAGVEQPAADPGARRASAPAVPAHAEAAGAAPAALAAPGAEGDATPTGVAAAAAVGLIAREAARRRRPGRFLCPECDGAAGFVEQPAAGADAAEPSTAAGAGAGGVGEAAFPAEPDRQRGRAAGGARGQSGQPAVAAPSTVC